MTNQIYVGLALSAHNDGVMNRSTFDNITLTSPTPSQLLVTQPANTTAGSPFALDVTAEDQFGNTFSSFNGIVTLGLSSNPGDDVLVGPLSVHASGGTAQFNGLTLDLAATGYTIQAIERRSLEHNDGRRSTSCRLRPQRWCSPIHCRRASPPEAQLT